MGFETEMRGVPEKYKKNPIIMNKWTVLKLLQNFEFLQSKNVIHYPIIM